MNIENVIRNQNATIADLHAKLDAFIEARKPVVIEDASLVEGEPIVTAAQFEAFVADTKTQFDSIVEQLAVLVNAFTPVESEHAKGSKSKK